MDPTKMREMRRKQWQNPQPPAGILVIGKGGTGGGGRGQGRGEARGAGRGKGQKGPVGEVGVGAKQGPEMEEGPEGKTEMGWKGERNFSRGRERNWEGNEDMNKDGRKEEKCM